MRLPGGVGAQRLEEGRHQIDRLDQRVAHGAARRVGRRGGIEDDQRDLRRRLVEQVLLAQPVVAEIVAVVGGEHDQRVLEQAALFHEGEQAPELVVDLLDQAHVVRDDLRAPRSRAKTAATRRSMKAAKTGCALARSSSERDRRAARPRPVHAVVGRRRDVGPVRLDVGEVQAPGLVAGLPR